MTKQDTEASVEKLYAAGKRPKMDHGLLDRDWEESRREDSSRDNESKNRLAVIVGEMIDGLLLLL